MSNAKQDQVPFGDREMMHDMLSSQKFITENYNAFANECASPEIKEQFMCLLNQEHEIGYKLFQEMQSRGWYSVPPAEQQKICDAKCMFENQV